MSLTLVMFCSEKNYAQAPDSLWMFHYGGTDKEIGFDAIEGSPGEYYLVGKTKSFSNGGSDAYIIKLDNNGGIIWEKHYGDYLDEQIVSICPALYGGYVMTGYTQTNENGAEIWCLWIDDAGDSLWSMTYGNFSSDQGSCIRPNSDQGYTMTARVTVFQWGDQVFLAKMDQAGDTLWTKVYGTPRQDYGHSFIETSDGGYMIVGRTYASYTGESGDAWTIRTDAGGDTLWTKKYGWDNGEDIFYCVLETEDGYIFAGQTRSTGPGYTNVYVVRTDFNGDTVWTRTYGGEIAQNCYAMHEKENGNYVLCGYSSSFSPYNDVYMLEIDPQGKMIWQESWGVAGGDEYMYGCRPTSDGGYIITGWTNYYGAWDDELFALKLGPPSSGIDDVHETGRWIAVYPNPVQDRATVQVQLPMSTTGAFQLFNIHGQLIQSRIVQGKEAFQLDVVALPAGIYSCRLSTCLAVETVKLVVTGR